MAAPRAESLFRQTIETPLGEMLMVGDGKSLLVLEFADAPDRIAAALRRRFGEATFTGGDPLGIRDRLAAYFRGDGRAIDDIPADGGGTPFQRRVWAALRAIPCGTTTSYGALARGFGQPTATRAVGLANGANPIAIVVPCHRVVGADGQLTGYGGGVARKRWLLEHEGALARRPPIA
ncbi:MAG: methylated-DNA--[protein]-cysteine S-methyltransferase [Alphaproteobacteria bacterium]|nr:methylated-DNA--[protein]-cysteine S-methyltransferase [Alphaproteobacteria bacterium]